MPRPFDKALTELGDRGASLEKSMEEITRVLAGVQATLQVTPGKVYAAVSGQYDMNGGRITDKLTFAPSEGEWLLIYQQGTYEKAVLEAQVFAKSRSLALLPKLLAELRSVQYNANTEASKVLDQFRSSMT